MIRVSEPVIGRSEIDQIVECLEAGWVSSTGPYVERFENAWADRCDRAQGVAVSNGTTALQLAVAALDLPAGSEIVMPSFTIISCALAAIYNDLVPVFVDCDPHTWCMDPGAVEAAITDRTAAVMLVHIYGHPVDADPILALADRHGLAVVEDAAEAHGARYLRDHGTGDERWVPCGSLGDVSAFSFYANKLVTTGEGGMVLADGDELIERARSLRNLAFLPDPTRRFEHEELGFNFRLTNPQAALGLAQIERLEQTVGAKRALAHSYTEALDDLPLQLPTQREWARNVYWMYGLVLDDDVPFDAAELARRLLEQGVETRPFFVGLHEQPVLRGRGLFGGASLPVTERLRRRGLYLPSGPGLDSSQQERVVSAVRKAMTA